MTAIAYPFVACVLITVSSTVANADETITQHSSNGNTAIVIQQNTSGEKSEVKVERRDGYLSIEQKAGRNRAVVIQRRAPW